MNKIITLLALLNIAVFAQQKGTFTDPRDKKKYNTVKIGELIWFAQNLDYRGSDGYMGLCYGDNPKQNIKKPENCKIYGRLYDLKEAKKACPDGWHLPNWYEWSALVNFIGRDEAGNKLKSKTGWKAYDFSEKNQKAPKCKWSGTDERGRPVEYNKCATDEYGFSALPGGSICRDCHSTAGEVGYWWVDDGVVTKHNYLIFQMYYHKENTEMSHSATVFSKLIANPVYYEDDLFSVRCVQEDPEAVARKAAEAEAARIAAEEEAARIAAEKAAEAEAARIAAEEAAKKAAEERRKKEEAIVKSGLTDPRDGTKYKVVKIGKQIWMTENLNFKGFTSDCYKSDIANCKKYGRLYNVSYRSVNEICPKGWHLPNKSEWEELIKYAGGEYFWNGIMALYKLDTKKLRAKNSWVGGNGTDDYGFSALPSGKFMISGCNCFLGLGDSGYWRGSDGCFSIDKDNASIFDCGRNDDLYSVRCVMD